MNRPLAALLEALDRLDRAARAAGDEYPSPWWAGTAGRVNDAEGASVLRTEVLADDPSQAHVVGNDPASVLARNSALRRLAETHSRCGSGCRTVGLLADAYAPGWRNS